MKVIGLIGGVSWYSTLEYYKIINTEVNKRLGGIHSAKLILYSVDLGEIKYYQDSGEPEKACRILVEAAKALERAGADFILICANTLHMFYDSISSSVSIPVIHIADAVAEKIRSKGIKVVGLLGTKKTMEADFYKERLKKHGIETIVPEEDERNEVDKIIFNELVVGVLKDESKKKLLKIIEHLKDKGVQGIILGCTELPLIVKEKDVDIPVFDTTYIHALKAVEEAFK